LKVIIKFFRINAKKFLAELCFFLINTSYLKKIINIYMKTRSVIQKKIINKE